MPNHTPNAGQHAVCVAVLLLFLPGLTTSAAEIDGARVYAQKCASCHGAAGEGTPDVPQKLFGDRSAFDLAEVITRSMPEGEPEECQGDEARAVAKWMLTEFYSPQAQARLNPPQKSLLRLTVSQYRNCVADLIEGFTWASQPGEKSGLTGRYYKSKSMRDSNKVIERLDSMVDFDFAEGTPGEGFDKPEEFSVLWDGSLVVDETGWYDFVLKTENGGRLFVNDTQNALIDAYVKSGDTDEYTGARFLLAGRMYPIRLNWFKFREKTSSVRLMWKPPHREVQPIPSRHLSPEHTSRVLVVETPFPPDDRSSGYIRGTAVSAEWDEATTYAAIEVADKLPEFLRSVARLKKGDDEQQRREKLQKFCQDLAYRAFRRPLTDEQRDNYVDRHFVDGTPDEIAVRRCVIGILKAPWFLYRDLGDPNDLHAVAERLSFALVDSTPNPDLLQAASKEWIKSDDGLDHYAWKLLNSYRGQVRLQEFLRVWLNMERLHEADKQADLYPSFNREILSDLRTSLEFTLREAATSEDGFRQLLTTSEFWLNGRLASFYGHDLAADTQAFQKVRLEPTHRAGITSHPFLLASLAYQDVSSPIHRGVFLSRGLLGRTLKPPPDSVSPTAPDLEPHLTTRERVIKQTSPQMCANCHTMINALGFPLEEFDAVGRHRTAEKDRPIDATGGYRLRDGRMKQFRGAVELSRFLAESRETRRSFARQLFHHMVQQPILAYGADTIDQLADEFSDSDLKMNSLMVNIALMAARPAGKTDP
ncbi:MAG: DUF1588 domain-containing protein [Planctomycetaceae bacterium]|nr:DUF1588 domain-containing protein [Planctomycetaceae bacterium]